MGNSQACFSSSSSHKNNANYNNLQRQLSKSKSNRNNNKSSSRSSIDSSSSSSCSNSQNKKKNYQMRDRNIENEDEVALRNQAVAAAKLFREYQRNSGAGDAASFVMSRSASVVYPSPSPAPAKKSSGLPRSSSTRPRSGSDNQHLAHSFQGLKSNNIEELESSHFVLVHGGGFGAWCWYKTMTLLEEAGFRVNAVDLTGSDTNTVANLAQYVKPLADIFDKLDHGKKVILVGHDFGGACISYVMELFPSKISRAIFVAATMLPNGQSTLDLFSQQIGQDDLLHQAQTFMYANGKDRPPTAIDHNKDMVKDLFFNQTPSKDVALASLSMKPMPFAPVMEKLCLSNAKYGSVRRFYVATMEDQAISLALQETMISSDPPEQVFRLKGSDHSPFFSRPQALHKIFLEIANLPPK